MNDLNNARLACRLGLTDDRRVATVITTHPQHAKEIGEELAGVVVVCNPEHPLDPTDIRRGTIIKFTVTRRNAEVAVDLLGALEQLQALEDWVGDAENIESSLKSSRLTPQQVVDIVRCHLK